MKTHTGGSGLFVHLLLTAFSAIALATVAVPASAAKKPWHSASGGGHNRFTCAIANPGPVTAGTPVTFTGSVSGDRPPYTVVWTFPHAAPRTVTTPDVQPGDTTATTTFNDDGRVTVKLQATASGRRPDTCTARLRVSVEPAPVCVPTEPAEMSCADAIDNDCNGLIDDADPDCQVTGGDPTARGDTYATPVGKTLTVQASRVSGVLYNDFDTDPASGGSRSTTQRFPRSRSATRHTVHCPCSPTARSPTRPMAVRVKTTTTVSPTWRATTKVTIRP